MNTEDRFLEITQLTKSYRAGKGAATVIVDNFNLPVRKGEFVTLIGHSGCGKSTVLSVIAGLSRATSGGVIIDGREVREPGTDRGMVFQSPCLLPWLTALENVLLAVGEVARHMSRKRQKLIAEHYLRLVGLEDAMTKRPNELSGGMRQRVGIARAFALSPKVLLLDEPFGMLDSLTRFELQEVLVDLWAKEQITAFMVTHDVDEALFLSDRIAMMTNGPHARLGGILQVPFGRPRNRAAVMEHPQYYELRDQLLSFLADHAHGPPVDTARQQPDEKPTRRIVTALPRGAAALEI